MASSFNLLQVTRDGKVQPRLTDGSFQDQFRAWPLPPPDGKYLGFEARTLDGNVWMIDGF